MVCYKFTYAVVIVGIYPRTTPKRFPGSRQAPRASREDKAPKKPKKLKVEPFVFLPLQLQKGCDN
jgi:hypothetical protein